MVEKEQLRFIFYEERKKAFDDKGGYPATFLLAEHRIQIPEIKP
jgi:hypothetical protein